MYTTVVHISTINPSTSVVTDRFYVSNPWPASVRPYWYGTYDAPPEPRLESVVFSVDPLGDGSQSVVYGKGEIVLNNADGRLDSLLTESVDSRSVEITVVNPGESAVLSGWPIVAEQFESSGENVILRFRSSAMGYDRVVQTKFFAGTGGVEGDSTLTGKPKPFGFGIVTNVRSQLVDGTKLVYILGHDIFKEQMAPLPVGLGFQVDPMAITSLAIYDSGVAFTQGADYTSMSDMTTNTPAAGTFRYLSAANSGDKCAYFRLGSMPVGEITHSARYIMAPNVLPVTTRPSQLANALLVPLSMGMGISLGLVGYLSTSDSTQVQATFPYSTSRYYGIDDKPTYIDWLHDLLAGGHAWIASIGTNNTRVRWLEEPSTAPAFWSYNTTITTTGITLTGDTIVSMERQAVTNGLFAGPSWRIAINADKNYNPMTTGFATSVSPSDRSKFSIQWQSTNTASDSSIQTPYPTAIDLTVETSFATSSGVDLATEAARQLGILKVGRYQYRIVARVALVSDFIPAAGNIITVQNFPRFGCDTSRKFQMLGYEVDLMSYDPDSNTFSVTMTVWG